MSPKQSPISLHEKKPGMSKFSMIVVCVVLGMAAILWVKNTVASFLPAKNNEPTKIVNTQANVMGSASSTSDAEIADLIARIARHIAIKQGESPTVATIQDASLLRQTDPKFYKEAENGDRLVIWSDQAILYSTKQDRLLAVVPVSLPSNMGSVSSTQQSVGSLPSESVLSAIKVEGATIEVRNGSGVPGTGKIVADKLKALGFNVLPAKEVTAGAKVYADLVGVVLRWDADSIRFPETDKALSSLEKVSDKGTAYDAELGVKGNYLVIVGGKFQK